jgi:hypothetical protein
LEELNSLERALLEKFVAGDDPIFSALRAQMALVKVVSRKFSGVGFYTLLHLPEGAPKVPGFQSFDLGDVVGEHPNAPHGVGFVLFVSHGLLRGIEGYTFGGTLWPEDTQEIRLSYAAGAEHDLWRGR